MAFICDKCGKEYEFVRHTESGTLPLPNVISADYDVPKRSHIYIKKYNFCSECMVKVMTFLEEKDCGA